jgi:hypothetical protein
MYARKTIRKKRREPQFINITAKNNKKKIHTLYSQMRLGAIYDRVVINRLNAWFKNDGKITEIVREERRRRGLEEENTTVHSSVYGTDDRNSTLQLMIKKRGNDFIHLTIHLAPEYFKTDERDAGMVHVVKNVYKSVASTRQQHYLRAIYAIEKIQDKPHSFHFSIQQRYDTPHIHNTVDQYDNEVKQEIDVMTAVLNQIFDETNDNYVGSAHPEPIEQNTDAILRNMNTRTTYIKRKNVGTYFTEGGSRATRKYRKNKM